MSWKRQGECCRCGECCRSGDPFNGEEGSSVVPGACPLYRHIEGKGHCSGYGVHRYYLGGCNVWPSIPEHIKDYPSCSYTFVWVDR